jgi:predicted XRE-type DNA-binding protein
MSMPGKAKVTIGSGNVFADLGFENADDMRLRADAVEQIRSIMAKRKMKQAEAAKLLGLKQPDVSALLNGRLTKFALERLLRFLTLLGQDVAIVVKSPPGKRRARMTFETA